MKHVAQVLNIYTRKITVQLFFVALIACAFWWWDILPSHEDHKWDAFIGVTAAVIAILLEQLAEVISHYRKFYQLDGHYRCESFASNDEPEACRALGIDADKLKKRLADNPDLTYPNKAQATIEHKGGTVLRVVLQEGTHDNQWSGDCIMESDTVGIMAWAYTKLGGRPNPWARNGIKRLAVVDRGNPLIICLHSYNNDGRFGRELLVKVADRIQRHTDEWPYDWKLSLSLVCGSIVALTILVLLYG